ncbi:competence/damage-inducible protein A [Alkaliphilus serpentinus]|uniref:Putative competence-damage inducible protein n=1 Tax=Alkaliphilus serpentinus TaxID=1482731 RepID=A0A833M935_9FIRM|nr:competence/damage-inducible protein A [Alkaliphilus serpentinus]KAB3526737.1 competence/damage-inducible protein A [Alkaliphilus serpentinus]
MKASIICIGTELLKGKTIDTNSYYIAKELVNQGFTIENKLIVGDEMKGLVNGLNFCFSTSDVIITIGGLGPTLDDITRDAIAAATGNPLELNEDIHKHIQHQIESRYKSCAANNIRQAYFPKGSKILPNPIGTAPGFLVEALDKKIYAIPGPPLEMKLMFDNEVLSYLREIIKVPTKTVSIEIIGLGESSFEESIDDIIKDHQNVIYGIYALNGKLTLTLTASGRNNEDIDNILEPIIEEIKKRYQKYIYSLKGESLEERIFYLLQEKNYTLSTAESCTGGLLASVLTGVSGISRVFDGGYVTYSNEFKIKELSVAKETIEEHGAVSKETAMEMLIGLKDKTQTSCGISITGIAGPTGGTPEKPVGLVYIGVYTPTGMEVLKYQFYGPRSRIQQLAVYNGLNQLRLSLNNLQNSI